ncbi:MAG: IPT/TIG domain-containing protein, partial [Gemmataceae bacterium]
QYGDNRLIPDFSQNWGTHRDLYGIPYNVVRGNSTPKVQVVIDDYADESDIVPVPLPAHVVLEGDYQDGPRFGLDNRGDSHLLLYDADNNIGYEFYRMSRPSENADGRWHAYQQTVWNFNTNSYRTLGWTSADAAGLPLLAGLARPDEGLPVSEGGQGAINHAIRFTLQNRLVLNQFTYPASHTANPGNTNANLMPPMGTRFRLKADVDISSFQPQSRIIAQAMKDYGLILADNGSNFFFSGASESVDLNNNIFLTWNNDDIHDTNNGIKSLNYSDFEIVDLTPIVTGLSTTQGQSGDTVTLVGQNFSGSSGQMKVFFGSVSTTDVTYVDDSRLQVKVPEGTGSVYVRVQSGADVPYDSRNVKGAIFGYGISTVNPAASFTYSGSPTIEAPVFTSGTQFNLQENRQGSFLISTTGNPTASLSIPSALPAGMTFVDNGNGTGYLQGKPTVGTRGTYGITVIASNGLTTSQEITLTIKPAKTKIRAVGTEAGRIATVAVYGEDDTRREIRPYGSGYKGGVRVAVADVNGDEIPDVITGPGIGISPTVKVFSGDTLTQIASFNAYSSSYLGGIFVAAGNVLQTGTAQVVVGPGFCGNGIVKVFDLRSGVRLVRTIQAFPSGTGVTVAAGDGVLVAGRAN